MTALADDGFSFVDLDDHLHVRYWRRRRPEQWWGVAWIPIFWTTLLFAGVFCASVRRDRRTRR